MNGQHRRKVIWAGLLLVLFMATQLLCTLILQNLEASLPAAAALYSPKGTGITMEQAVLLGELDDITAGALSGETLTSVSVPARGTSEMVYTLFATPKAGWVLPIRLIYGGWFLHSEEPSLLAQAVIPESLSLSLFGTGEPAGLTLYADGRAYTVCGVYRDESGFFARIGGTGRPCVYLSDPLRWEQTPAATICLSDAAQTEPEALLRRVSGYLGLALEGEIRNHPHRVMLGHAIRDIFLLLCTFYLAALLVTLSEKILYRAVSRSGGETSRRIMDAGTAAVLILGALWGLCVLLRRLEIPGEYLPPDGQFGLSFYKEAILAFVQKINLAGGPGYDYERTLLVHILRLLLLSMLSLVLFVAGSTRLYQIVRAKLKRDCHDG